MKSPTLTAMALCLMTPYSLHAATERDLESHVHGGATLNIATDDSTLFLEFDSPWMNLVGFEHEPSTDEQRAAVAESIQRLEQGSELFLFTGTQCDMVEVAVESSMESEHGDEDHDDDGHEEHGDEDHDDEGHEEHGDEDHADEGHEEHDDEDHADEGHEEHGTEHSAVVVNYVFNCVDLNELETIGVELFSAWPGIDDIDVQLAGPNGQDAVELAPDNNLLDVSSVL